MSRSRPQQPARPPVFVRAQRLPVDEVSIVQAGSNHVPHPNPFRGAAGHDTPTSPFSRQV
ncbi:hypothetical protein L842_5631 [Mycobacterium intracellulare MIN_052511_1280]|nr:hypothetical protein L842_5631 [Mycobacterium intracellulare MIN_052511_1280]